ncbi:MAG: sulfatase-like hydrolase/transferase [Planctomycetes bacterium]|nr:sulfatase-like hydrolase/transferase [Planctomycetota bacterium]
MHLPRAVSFSLLLTGTLFVAQQPATQQPATTSAPPKRPHVIVIVSDDAGYADFGVQGARDIRTPRIDSIAQGGVRCTQGYVSGSVCSPTRAGLMTGRYQQRFGHEKNIPPQWSEENGLPLDERTFADELLAAGYGTVALGKWHLGYADHFHPRSRGFEHYYGFLQGQRSYFPLERVTRLNRLLRDRDVAPESFDYMTDELGRAAAKFIAERGDRPLFLYLAFNAVHGPMHATEQDLVGTVGPQRRRKLIAMTHALDRAVGYVLDALDEQGIADDTLLFFVNDNGGATNNASKNAPLRGHKAQVFEGGIRVPFLVRWPAGLPQGAVYEQPVIALDILPTSLAAAGAGRGGAKPLDGVDLLPFLRGEREGAPHDALFWKMGDTWAVRSGDHKLLHQEKGAPMLFDVAADIGEQNDLAAAQPERVAALQARYDAWAAQLMKPRWGAGAEKDGDD